MSQNDEKSLALHKQNFKIYKQKYLLASFMLKVFGIETWQWREAMAAYQYYLERLANPKKKDSFDGLLRDLLSVYVLDSSILTMKQIQAG